MESSDDVEVLSRAIEKLLHDKRKREASGDSIDHDDHLLLSSLISQMESLSPKPSKITDETTREDEEEKTEQSLDSSLSKGKQDGQRHLEENVKEIAKDIKKMKQQNNITQVLLSAMIILTLTWQLSEYSMIYMIKDRLSHPVKSIGGILSGMFKGKTRQIQNQLHESSSTSKDQDNNNNGNNGTRLHMPELREFGFNENKD